MPDNRRIAKTRGELEASQGGSLRWSRALAVFFLKYHGGASDTALPELTGNSGQVELVHHAPASSDLGLDQPKGVGIKEIGLGCHLISHLVQDSEHVPGIIGQEVHG